jgi:hypothetical protein
MAGNVRVVLNSRGVDDILKSDGVHDLLLNMAQEIADRAGPGMIAGSRIGRNRARASVITGTWEAKHAQATRQALTVAFGGASVGAASTLMYTTKAGKTRAASAAQIANWTRGSAAAAMAEALGDV